MRFRRPHHLGRPLLTACIVLATLFLAGCAGDSASQRADRAAAAGPVHVLIANGWVDSSSGSEEASVYFVIRNLETATRTLVGASSPHAESISIRRTAIVDGGWSSEAMPDGMPIPPQADVAFVPRGLFLALETKATLSPGESVPVTLEFADGRTAAFEAIVKSE